MVAVAPHPFGNIFLPLFVPILAPAGILCGPFVIKFIYDKHAVFIAQVEKRFAVRIMRRTYMIESEILKHPDALLHRARV